MSPICDLRKRSTLRGQMKTIPAHNNNLTGYHSFTGKVPPPEPQQTNKVSVDKCCWLCEELYIDYDGDRSCGRNNKAVKQNDSCKYFKLNEDLTNNGKQEQAPQA